MELFRTSGFSRSHLFFTVALVIALSFPFFIGEALLLAPLFLAALLGLLVTIPGNWKSEINLIYLLLLLTFLAPPIEISNSIPLIRPEQALFLLAFPLIIYFRNDGIHPQVQPLVLAFSLFIGYQLFSVFYGAFVKGITIGYKDFAEIIRVSQYLLGAFLIANFKLSDRDYLRILYVIAGLYAASAVIGLCQYYSLFGLDTLTAPYYSEGRLWSVNIRMFGTFINPNTYGTFLAIGMVFGVALMALSTTLFRKIIFFAFFLLLFWALILTESRTALVSLFLGLITFFVSYNHFIHKNLFRALFPLLAFSILFVLLFLLLRSDLVDRFSTLLNIMDDQSWQIRLFAWYVNLRVFLDSWLLGYGPSLHQFSPIVDNEYLLILRRYGILGFLIYLNLYWVAFRKCVTHSYQKNASSLFRLIFLASLIIFLTGNLTNQIFHEMQFMAFWSVMVGLLFNRYTTKVNSDD